jgi:hypothetical protein
VAFLEPVDYLLQKAFLPTRHGHQPAPPVELCDFLIDDPIGSFPAGKIQNLRHGAALRAALTVG